jgi:hypothetical protein
MRAAVNLSCSRASIEQLLAGKAKRSTLKARAEAVDKLAQDINRFCGWPALVGSMNQDARRIRERMAAK